MNKIIKSLTVITISLFSLQSCNKGDDENISTNQKKIEAKVNGKEWAGEGDYFIAFGNTPQLFSITGRNDTSQFTIELRATGKGTYTTIDDGYYFSLPQKTNYDIKSGSVTITEVTSKNLATGSFEFEAENQASGKKVKITQGKFTQVQGLGFW